MAIRCPGCGREYDVTLFGFGRTLRCTCGRRVGVEASIPRPDDEPPRFVADSMLGRLARWLRALGLDTAFDAAYDDEEIVRVAFREGRALLTRDRELLEEWRLDGALLLESDDPIEQLRRVVERFGLRDEARLFTRCMVCNASLEDVESEELAGAVPEGVRERRDDFSRCPSCGKVYWEGSHTRRMRARLETVLGEGPPAP